jgi:hypothetical protein
MLNFQTTCIKQAFGGAEGGGGCGIRWKNFVFPYFINFFDMHIFQLPYVFSFFLFASNFNTLISFTF